MTVVVSLLFFVGCMIYHCETTTITSEGSLDGKWKFAEDSSVTLTCAIPSYVGSMSWKLNSTVVAECSGAGCHQVKTSGGTFIFGFDTTNFIFIWTINPIKLALHGQLVECVGGGAAFNFSAIVEAIVQDKQETEIRTALIMAGLSIAIIGIEIIIIAIICGIICYYRAKKVEPLCDCCFPMTMCCGSFDTFSKKMLQPEEMWSDIHSSSLKVSSLELHKRKHIIEEFRKTLPENLHDKDWIKVLGVLGQFIDTLEEIQKKVNS